MPDRKAALDRLVAARAALIAARREITGAVELSPAETRQELSVLEETLGRVLSTTWRIAERLYVMLPEEGENSAPEGE